MKILVVEDDLTIQKQLKNLCPVMDMRLTQLPIFQT